MGRGADGGTVDVVAVANQLLVELHRVLVEPARVLLGLGATDELEQRLVARVDVLAARLCDGDAEERSSIAHAVIATVHRAADTCAPDDAWWDTALGQACRAAFWASA
jgi:hypothetical protein